MLTRKHCRLLTMVGIMIPLSTLGDVEVIEMESGDLAAAAATGGIAGHLGLPVAGEGEAGGTVGGETGGSEDPDAILPVPSRQGTVTPSGAQGPVQTQGGPQPTTPGRVPVTQKSGGDSSLTDNPKIIGNIGWVAPGTMTSMANSLWQESQAAIDSTDKIYLNDEAVTEYMTNQSLILTQYNDALLVNTDNASVQALLSVLAGGSFIETLWSQTIYKLTLSADVIFRQINTCWSNPKSTCISIASFTDLCKDKSRKKRFDSKSLLLIPEPFHQISFRALTGNADPTLMVHSRPYVREFHESQRQRKPHYLQRHALGSTLHPGLR